jgi:hypothetical protein
VVYEGDRFTRVDRAAALRELHASLQHALDDDETERRAQSKRCFPMCGVSMPAIATPKPTSPSTAERAGLRDLTKFAWPVH